MRFTTEQLRKIVDGAVASARIHPRDRDGWLVRCAAGGTAAGQAISALLTLTPAGPAVAARWAREAAAPATDPDDPDGVYAALWPGPATVRPSRGTDRNDPLYPPNLRGDGTRSLASAAPDPTHEPVPGHGVVTVIHEHQHSDYAGGQHVHEHTHTGDASHQPGTNHMHQEAAAVQLTDPASAGIAARTATSGLSHLTDDQLYARMFGG